MLIQSKKLVVNVCNSPDFCTFALSILKIEFMFGIEHFLTFVVSAFIFIMAPGIDTIFVLNKSISQGRQSGIYAALGVNSGVLVHTLFASLGLSLIIAQSALAFSIVKYAGAAYLFYLGITKLVTKKHTIALDTASGKEKESRKKSYVSGTLTNVLNPKVALFFMAFFPQFIRPEAINSPLPFIVLGTTYATIGILWFMILTLFTSTFSDKLMSNRNFSKWIDKVSGTAYILLGMKIALVKR